ncbi:hypothetical protein WOLCODRAFT_24379 [Wolfiporia cocos MD-104 SS10]|uniref:Chromatin modification-related protein n=1 Tax=Wolfiporia cocos (strain MD-104) TaxID=742152 RepID=A0A2H3JW48_WOLCO|nr:hypothetical protein WOLCODRAFT_24379 [Wolfiporia cocos MD-104 SS10]
MSQANLEEAATIAAEYVSSLDNLPGETQFLLDEIRHREQRAHELQQEIQRESSKYIRHSLKSAPGQALSARDAAIPDSVAGYYTEMDQLAAEKVALAERMVQLVARARARLNHDLDRVLALQGEADPALQGGLFAPSARAAASVVDRVNESLRSAIAIPEAVPAPPAAPPQPPTKKRRTMGAASAGSIKLPSPAPMTAGAYGAQRSRLGQQVSVRPSPLRSRRATASSGADPDEDAEGEDDVDDALEEGGDAEDKELYCFCQKLSYGEMIACDNPNCRYQWFHLPCVNLKPPLPENWFCEDCVANMKKGVAGGVGAGRKGRKK